jgi:hypothetical protein
MVATITTFEVVQQIRLNDFVHVFIQRNGISYVVENYQPIRNEYYENKNNTRQQSNTMEGRSQS